MDAVHFSFHPWNLARLSFAFGFVLLHTAAIGAAVLIFTLAALPWRVGRTGRVALAGGILRATPLVCLLLLPGAFGYSPSLLPLWPTTLAGVAGIAAAALVNWARPRYRHASQALRLVAGVLIFIVPAFIFYPSVRHFADRGLQRLIEERFASDALMQRSALQGRLLSALARIDAIPIPDLTGGNPEGPVPSAPAFQVWSQTDSRLRAIDFGRRALRCGRLARQSLRAEPADTPRPRKNGPKRAVPWETFEEVSPFGSEERLLLHAGRGICRQQDGEKDLANGAGNPAGSIVVHVMLDYDALPFITSRSPDYELVRPATGVPQEGTSGRDVEFVVYGWGRRPLYALSDCVWQLDEALLNRIASSRQPFWTRMTTGDRDYETYVSNDRAGMYVLGYPRGTPLDHLVSLAELATLAGAGYVLLLVLAGLGWAVAGRAGASGAELLREVRASFYRKLFLAFVAASVVPVVILAFVTRAFFATQLLAGIESDAVRTAAVAQRVIEEISLQQRGTAGGPAPDDDLMVWLSNAIDQDVNIFDGARLLATSERDCLLPACCPSAHRRRSTAPSRSIGSTSFVGEETAGVFRYMLAAAPVRVGGGEAILTVPLAPDSRRPTARLTRSTAASCSPHCCSYFSARASGIPWRSASATRSSRLTRATRRIARGDLSARILPTSSDELRRLVHDFNRMAADLERQRAELQRTHRLEAWAEMARQVAHEIKNPLTPIQLSAEHLLRVTPTGDARCLRFSRNA